MAEGLVVLAVLAVFWLAAGWLGRLQDAALLARHQSSYQAFMLTRDLSAARAHLVAQPLSRGAQPGRGGHAATGLLHQWQPAPDGILLVRAQTRSLLPPPAVLRAGSFDDAYNRPIRHAAILAGAAHASDDLHAQRIVMRSEAGWRRVAQPAQRAGRDIARRLAGVDQGWRRPAPHFDWAAPWAGRVPAGVRRRLPVHVHAGLRRPIAGELHAN